jgi:hypothetical protein
MIVDRRCSGLNDKHIIVANIFFNFNFDVVVAESMDIDLAGLNAEMLADRIGQIRMCCCRKIF